MRLEGWNVCCSSAVVAQAFSDGRLCLGLQPSGRCRPAQDLAVNGGRRVLFLASDDGGAAAEIGALAENLGFGPIELGWLSEGGLVVRARGKSWGQLIFTMGSVSTDNSGSQSRRSASCTKIRRTNSDTVGLGKRRGIRQINADHDGTKAAKRLVRNRTRNRSLGQWLGSSDRWIAYALHCSRSTLSKGTGRAEVNGPLLLHASARPIGVTCPHSALNSRRGRGYDCFLLQTPQTS
ncbi:hypothetical protein Rleg9DRAFT_5743 [Rhizobium leguminosarum bv. trifolii WSM597]|uniref:Uncharacterized protein n=1 Tax=Rhizobium leguminosarum bv. trifolii WSM597 TaxID=754764 RepID=I9NFS1_RHILT|nr:hypothetical protein Rleg9DRAFT_5743 [Rhizobium leguminosarum bv. trifolii WSM597]